MYLIPLIIINNLLQKSYYIGKKSISAYYQLCEKANYNGNQ